MMALGTTTTAAANSSSNDTRISDLPLHLFEKLLSSPRSTANPTIDASSLRQQIISKLQTNNTSDDGATTVRELLRLAPTTLLSKVDPCLTYKEVNILLSRIHCECSAQSMSALGIIQRLNQSTCQKIPTGLTTLDECLQGGVPIGSITEVVGRAGVGKTHLSQQLTVLAATKYNGGCIFIDAEKKLNLNRLQEISYERSLAEQSSSGQQQQQLQQQQHANDITQQMLQNVTVREVLTTSELLEHLDQLEDEIIGRNSTAKEQQSTNDNISSCRRLPVRLIVIDSIAAPIKRDFDMMGSSSTNIAAQRNTAIFQIAKKLKQLAYDYQLAVMVVNQVGSGSSMSARLDSGRGNDGEFSASLGTAWQHCVSTRIVLEHDDDQHRLQQNQQHQYSGSSTAHNIPVHTASTRTAMLTKSLVSKRMQLPFEVTTQGLFEVEVPSA